MNGLNRMLVRIGCCVIPDTYPAPPPQPVQSWKDRMVPVRLFHERSELIEQFKYEREQWYVAPVIQPPSNPKSRLIRASAGALGWTTEESPELVEQNRAIRSNK